MITILMFSGGYESVVCLKRLVDEGVTPSLFHFKTKKFNNENERMIRKVTRIISPDSPYYIFNSYQTGYHAFLEWHSSSGYDYPYYGINYKHHGKDKYFYPLLYGDRIVLGYTRWVYDDVNMDNRLCYKRYQNKFIDDCNKLNLPFVFPLADMRRPQIDRELNSLPEIIKDNVISSTRRYAKRYVI